jgi:hypothetical protein
VTFYNLLDIILFIKDQPKLRPATVSLTILFAAGRLSQSRPPSSTSSFSSALQQHPLWPHPLSGCPPAAEATPLPSTLYTLERSPVPDKLKTLTSLPPHTTPKLRHYLLPTSSHHHTAHPPPSRRTRERTKKLRGLGHIWSSN